MVLSHALRGGPDRIHPHPDRHPPPETLRRKDGIRSGNPAVRKAVANEETVVPGPMKGGTEAVASASPGDTTTSVGRMTDTARSC